jgi:hypothetical protein
MNQALVAALNQRRIPRVIRDAVDTAQGQPPCDALTLRSGTARRVRPDHPRSLLGALGRHRVRAALHLQAQPPGAAG